MNPAPPLAPLRLYVRFPFKLVEQQSCVCEVAAHSHVEQSVTDLAVTWKCTAWPQGKMIWRLRHPLAPYQEGAAETFSVVPKENGQHVLAVTAEVQLASGEKQTATGQVVVKPGVSSIYIHSRQYSSSLRIQGDGNFINESSFGAETPDDIATQPWMDDFAEVPLKWTRVILNPPPPGEELAPDDPHWPMELGEWKRIPSSGLFFLSTPVPQALWKAIMPPSYRDWLKKKDRAKAQSFAKWLDDKYPVIGTTFPEAMDFCAAFHQRCVQLGLLNECWSVRIPTQAEWSEAAGPPPSGPNMRRYCHNVGLLPASAPDTGLRSIAAMKSKSARTLPNEYGLYGMFGDVAEWCLPRMGQDGDLPEKAILAGGSWRPDTLNACQGKTVALVPINRRSSHGGFRMVAVPPDHPSQFA